jgi:hypothetical protein
MNHLAPRHLITLLLIIVCTFASQRANAQDSAKVVNAWDERSVEVRKAPDQVMEGYKKDADYRYDRYQNPESLWDRFLQWLWSLVPHGKVTSNITNWVLIILAAITLTFLVFVLFGIKIKSLFILSKNANSLHPEFALNGDDIHDSKLTDLLRLYIETRALRQATRVMYLLVLRELDKNGFIRWQKGKTNSDYCYELPNPDIKGEFKKMVLAYEYVWYGEFELSDHQFEEIQRQYDLFNRQIVHQSTQYGNKKG